TIADFNGNGHNDIASAYTVRTIELFRTGTIAVQLNDGMGHFSVVRASTFSVGATIPERGLLTALAAGDFDGDGNMDVAVSDYENNTLPILKGNGDGTFTEANLIGGVIRPEAVAVANFDGNAGNRPGLAVANRHGGSNGNGSIVILQNNSSGPGDF